ncbi:MAG: hypothetical protein JWL79_864 [Frankiales bacterium]|nr:hypothetical protein [Frankiales bacterium]
MPDEPEDSADPTAPVAPTEQAPAPAVKRPPVAAPVKAPAKKAPAKPAAAKKAPAKTPVKRTVKKVAVPDQGGRPATTPWPVAQRPVPPKTPRAATVPSLAPAPPAVEPGRERDGVARFLVAVAVLLLAAAAGLGAAAFVEHRDTAYRASVVVRLDPGPAPALATDQTLSAGGTTYLRLAATHEFTLNAAMHAGLATSVVKGDVQTHQRAPRQIELDAFAKTGKEAEELATGAGDAFIELVNLNEAVTQTSAGDRLLAAVVTPPGGVSKTAPKDRNAWIAGGLAAGAVVVLAGLALLLRRTRRA